MNRKQYPLRRAYAMSFNKCQGQTLQKVVCDLRKQVFSHGMLYVAFSRVTKYDGIKLLISKSQLTICMDDDNNIFESPLIQNIVYNEAIDATVTDGII